MGENWENWRLKKRGQYDEAALTEDIRTDRKCLPRYFEILLTFGRSSLSRHCGLEKEW